MTYVAAKKDLNLYFNFCEELKSTSVHDLELIATEVPIKDMTAYYVLAKASTESTTTVVKGIAATVRYLAKVYTIEKSIEWWTTRLLENAQLFLEDTKATYETIH